jgi:hypothetical protein
MVLYCTFAQFLSRSLSPRLRAFSARESLLQYSIESVPCHETCLYVTYGKTSNLNSDAVCQDLDDNHLSWKTSLPFQFARHEKSVCHPPPTSFSALTTSWEIRGCHSNITPTLHLQDLVIARRGHTVTRFSDHLTVIQMGQQNSLVSCAGTTVWGLG